MPLSEQIARRVAEALEDRDRAEKRVRHAPEDELAERVEVLVGSEAGLRTELDAAAEELDRSRKAPQ